MTDTKPTLEEMIKFQQDECDASINTKECKYLDFRKTILASLKELAAIKSTPKPDVVCYYTANVNNSEVGTILMGDNLKLTFDGETGELKSAEVLK